MIPGLVAGEKMSSLFPSVLYSLATSLALRCQHLFVCFGCFAAVASTSKPFASLKRQSFTSFVVSHLYTSCSDSVKGTCSVAS